MKTSKKLLSLLLVLAMVFALGCTAYASGAPADDADTSTPTEETGDAAETPAEGEEAEEETPAEEEAPAEETPAETASKIVIIHTNDIHGTIENYAKVAALKAEYEAEGAAVLLVDDGDFIQGSIYVSESQGAAAIELMNLAGYDVATLGNHEFDYSWQNLANIAKNAEFPIISNVTRNGKAMFDASWTVEVGGAKIGFFGLETPETATKAHPAKIVGVGFMAGDELYGYAQDQVDALVADGCDYVICLGHLGISDESTGNRSVDVLAKVTGIDVFIDGHSENTNAEIASVAAGNKVGDTLLVSAGSKGSHIGVITIEDGVISFSDLVAADYIGADSAVAARANEIKAEIDAEYGEVFAKTEVDLNGERAPGNRTEETNMGDLIADAMLWYALEQGDMGVDEANVVAVTNGGGIRAAIAAGDITKADVNTVLPFGNTVAYVTVTGEVLLEALEASTYCTPESVGAFPQVSGIEFTVDTNKAYDQGDLYPDSTYYGPASIQRVTINSINGEEFDPEATYVVVSNDFLAAGGDTYYAFSVSDSVDTGAALDVVVMDYITEVLDGVVTAEQYGESAGRITILAPVFTDVASTSWYYEAVMTAYNNGLMTGVSATTFAPNTNMTRAMIVTMLYRLAGEPAVEGNVSDVFADCTDGSWYANAVLWASETGVVTGRNATTFDPNGTLTRQELAAILYRYCGSAAVENAELTFADADEIASWASDAVAYCVESGLMSGVSATEFDATGSANRAMGATVLVRLDGMDIEPPVAPAEDETAEEETPAEGEETTEETPAEGEEATEETPEDTTEEETPAEGEETTDDTTTEGETEDTATEEAAA